MMVTVSTHQYEFSHGRKPRGIGHWAFAFDGQNNLEQLFWVHPDMTIGGSGGTYGQAKRLASAEARKRGVRRGEVAT